MRIGFLFNHDALHQMPHTMPIAAALAKQGVALDILASSPEQLNFARSLMPGSPDARFIELGVGAAARLADRALSNVAPFRRVEILRENLAHFRSLDALVVPETTTTLLKTRWGLDQPKLIYFPHGAGDTAVGFQPVTHEFDFVLLSGPKVRDRMLAQGLIRAEDHAVVGYPKFDLVDLNARPRFFDNDRPTVLYNPHFNPLHSSWYEMGAAVLEWFASQDRFNLIFAPHVMLFKRRVQVSLIQRKARVRRDVPQRLRELPHIRIDTGSPYSIDMSYTRAADIYIGDASSQIYEWITRPRPAIFLNSHKAKWQNDPNYTHWRLGEVIDTVQALPSALDRAVIGPASHADIQRVARDLTFAPGDQPAGERAAAAILDYLARTGVRKAS